MSPDDCRRVIPSQQEEFRRRAISMVQSGTPPTEVARHLDLEAIAEPSPTPGLRLNGIRGVEKVFPEIKQAYEKAAS